MKVRYSAITKAVVITVIFLLIVVFIFTHLPRSMEFTVTVYKYEENADGDNLPNFDKPIEMVCSLRKWKLYFGGDIFHGSVNIDGRTFVTPEDTRWYNFRNRDGVIALACQDPDTGSLWTGSIEYDDDFSNLYIYLDESVYVSRSGFQWGQGEYNRYMSHTLPDDVAAYLAP